jgi:tRNA threonylcarbamoyladenosine biosynthesis protein TsaB
MTILGIETSTAVCSVGLARLNGAAGQAKESDLHTERSLVESHIHSEKLLTLIQEICVEQSLQLSQIDGVAVSIGPGSFTGLRIGLSTAKGLCCSLGKPLIAVPTFESIATSVLSSHPECARAVICVDAKQGEFYIGVYERKNGLFHETLPVHIGSLSSLRTLINKDTVIAADCTDGIKTALDDSITLEEMLPFCRGDVVANIAIEKLMLGEKNTWENLEPMYLKDFVIRMHAKKEQ